MKILYDHQAFTYQKWGGVSKSFCELITHRPMGMDYEISVVESDNVHLRESHLVDYILPVSRDLASFHSKHSFLGREKIYNFLGEAGFLHTAEVTNKRSSIKKIKEGDYDVFHPTFFDNYFLPYLHGKPFVLTVHDLMPELFGWYSKDPQIVNKPELCEEASAIIAVSENTKKDLCRIYKVPENKVHVIYHGFPEKIKSVARDKRVVENPYFLYVGRRDGYKNWSQTIMDFADFHKNHPDVMMICTGAAFSEQETQLLRDLHIDNVVRAIFASDVQMANLYAHAIAFIFPSLYEGFGMPILESFAYGCPTLLNNKSCFPEIGGDAAIYFDSEQGKSNLLQKMEDAYSMTSAEREDIKAKGIQRLKKFSWSKSSEMLFNIYKGL